MMLAGGTEHFLGQCVLFAAPPPLLPFPFVKCWYERHRFPLTVAQVAPTPGPR